MSYESQRDRRITRRLMILGGLKGGVLALLGTRLYDLQILRGKGYRTRAEHNRIDTEWIPPSRGLISDRFGHHLAVNNTNYQLVLDPRKMQDLSVTLQNVALFIPNLPIDHTSIRQKIQRNSHPIILYDSMDWNEMATIEAYFDEMPELSTQKTEFRSYPYRKVTAHVVGYVGSVEAHEQNSQDPLLSLPGFQIGKTGVEKYHDQMLRGRAGKVSVAVNANGQTIHKFQQKEQQQGHPITLTLDMRLQQFTQQRISDYRSATAIVMDTNTGEIYSMVSTPSFNPNYFSTGMDQQTWITLSNDPLAPLFNRTIAGLYAPGSTFKVVVALAALEANLILPEFTVECSGSLQLGQRPFHCWKRRGHGLMDLYAALEQSCDVYFYELSRRLTIEQISGMAQRLGLGHKLGIDLPGEKEGLIPRQSLTEQESHLPWQQGDTLNLAIGQGYIETTPLQLATMTARLVNRGHKVVPYLTSDQHNNKTKQWTPLGLNQHNLDILTTAMKHVTMHRQGTAYHARITEQGFEMGGKTGTTQVRAISRHERSRGIIQNADRPWEERDHALFIGFAPLHQPRYVTSVVVEHGGSGAQIAAPIASDLLLFAQKYESNKTTL